MTGFRGGAVPPPHDGPTVAELAREAARSAERPPNECPHHVTADPRPGIVSVELEDRHPAGWSGAAYACGCRWEWREHTGWNFYPAQAPSVGGRPVDLVIVDDPE